MNLVDWLKMMVGCRRSEEVVDPNIETRPSTSALKRALLTALRCVDPDAEKRPKMSQVVRMLESEEYPIPREVWPLILIFPNLVWQFVPCEITHLVLYNNILNGKNKTKHKGEGAGKTKGIRKKNYIPFLKRKKKLRHLFWDPFEATYSVL